MRYPCIFSADVHIEGKRFDPGFAGSFEQMALWAFQQHQVNPEKEINVSALHVVHTGDGQTHMNLSAITPSELHEAKEKLTQGDASIAWFLVQIGLATQDQFPGLDKY